MTKWLSLYYISAVLLLGFTLTTAYRCLNSYDTTWDDIQVPFLFMLGLTLLCALLHRKISKHL